MAYVFVLVFVAALVGLFKPYLPHSKRWHFALGAVASFFAIAAFVPPPTPEERAARARLEAEEQSARERAEAQEKATQLAAEQSKITDKVPASLIAAANYTRGEYPDLYRQIGKATFSKLSKLEPGAIYAASESQNCDAVQSAGVSDRSRKGAALWFVDCENGNRFMITQEQAAAALARFKGKKLHQADLGESCTTSTVAMCKATAAQKDAKEAEIVSVCDMLLKRAVLSASSLDVAWSWDYGISDEPDIVIVQRDFDSQNGFGATIRSRYHCEVNAATRQITKFRVQGAAGVQKVI